MQSTAVRIFKHSRGTSNGSVVIVLFWTATKRLVDDGARVSVDDRQGHGHKHVLPHEEEGTRECSRHRVDVEAQVNGYYGLPPLSIACEHDQRTVVKLLVSCGACVGGDYDLD